VNLKDSLFNAAKAKAKTSKTRQPVGPNGQKLVPSVTRVFSESRDMYVYLQAYQQTALNAGPLVAYSVSTTRTPRFWKHNGLFLAVPQPSTTLNRLCFQNLGVRVVETDVRKLTGLHSRQSADKLEGKHTYLDLSLNTRVTLGTSSAHVTNGLAAFCWSWPLLFAALKESL